MLTNIYSYNIINPVVNKKRAWFDIKKGLIFMPTNINYRYFVECALNVDKLGRQYYILLSNHKFNENCRLCQVDGYGRVKIPVRGELKDYLNSNYNCNCNFNINMKLIDSYDIYDVYCISI